MLLCLVAGTLGAAGLSGRWTGSVKMTLDGTEMEMPHEIVLEHNGDAISGKAGPGEGQLWPIANAKLAGSDLTFDVKVPDGPAFAYKLAVSGAEMAGEYKMTAEGHVSIAKIAVKKR
jgi:hypothetical protein